MFYVTMVYDIMICCTIWNDKMLFDVMFDDGMLT